MTKEEQILHAIESGCNKSQDLAERYGKSASYYIKKLEKLGCISKVGGGFYRKISDLPFTNKS